jgi:hypothetical protein
MIMVFKAWRYDGKEKSHLYLSSGSVSERCNPTRLDEFCNNRNTKYQPEWHGYIQINFFLCDVVLVEII